MQLKRNKDLEFETLKKIHKKQIIIGALAICAIGGALTFNLTKAKYKLTQDIPLVRGTVNYKVPDMRVVALYTENDNGDYTEANNVPTSGYTLNPEKSMCKVYDGTTSIENAPKDNNVTIEYKNGSVKFVNITKKNTRCYLYFNTIKDTEKPIISNVATTVTKTEINVTVKATDNEGVTEYWYQLNSNTPIKGTGNTYQFTGLTAGTTYSVKVYVKDAAGNTSDTTTKKVTTASPTSEDILAKLNITAKTTTPDFSQIATTDEGVFKAEDGMYGGSSYYWRGAVTNNYVKFANKCWRIIRINGDGTLRLIYDGTSCHTNGTNADSIAKTSVAYNTNSNQSNYVGWTYTGTSQRPSDLTTSTASNAKTQLESWYTSNITGTNATKVVQGKYCNDRNVQTGSTWAIAPSSTFYYAAQERLYTSKKPTLNCPNSDVYQLSVGLITADEIVYAGGTNTNYNRYYYLYNGQEYWTMSPNFWFKGSVMIRVDSGGSLASKNTSDTTLGLRPVINLKADVTFKPGSDGTLNNPYVVN